MTDIKTPKQPETAGTDEHSTDDQTNGDQTTTLAQAIRKAAIGLAIFAFFTAGIISVTQQLTADTIKENERAYEARLLLSLLSDQKPDQKTDQKTDQEPDQEPSNSENLNNDLDASNSILDSTQPLNIESITRLDLLNVGDDELFYQVFDNANKHITAVILPLIAPEGYTEAIRLIVGISINGELIGVRVTKHKETPGLGDQIETEKSDWIYKFNNRSLDNPGESGWYVKKDGGEFDQMTGATITPRALVKAVHQSLMFFQINKLALLKQYETLPATTEQNETTGKVN